MKENNVKIYKYVLGTDKNNSTTYLKIGQIIDVRYDESGIDKIEIEFFDSTRGPSLIKGLRELDEQFYKIKCDFYDFQNQFKILKFED